MVMYYGHGISLNPYGFFGKRTALAEAVAGAISNAEKLAAYWGDKGHGYAFRVDDRNLCYVDEYGDAFGSYSVIELVAFPITRITPCGFRICTGHTATGETTRIILHDWTKKWACLTAVEAVQSFIARRERMASIYEARAKSARKIASEAERFLEVETPAPQAASDLPKGMWRNAKGFLTVACEGCGRPYEWPAEPEDFEMGAPGNVCGGSPRCCP